MHTEPCFVGVVIRLCTRHADVRVACTLIYSAHAELLLVCLICDIGLIRGRKLDQIASVQIAVLDIKTGGKTRSHS